MGSLTAVALTTYATPCRLVYWQSPLKEEAPSPSAASLPIYRKDGARPSHFLIFVFFYVLCCSVYFCVVLFIVCFVSFSVLFVCVCVLYYCHRVATQLQLTNIIYHIILYHIIQIYRVSIKSFPDYKHLLQVNYVEYKHIFFSKCNSTQEVFLQHISTLQHVLLLYSLQFSCSKCL